LPISIDEYIEKWGIKVTIVEELPDYDNDPYFVKKAEEAKAILEEHGLPKEYTGKCGIPEGFNMKKYQQHL
jgi:hypothetical protein